MKNVTYWNRGFTLIELLVVISIIGLLSSVVLASLNSARAKARDAVRKSDMHQIRTAMELYYSTNQTYLIPGTGSNGCGCGWFNRQDPVYVQSIGAGLVAASLLGKAPADPVPTQSGQYMLYPCQNGFFAYAHLENPSAADQATYDNSKLLGCGNLDTYTMNYAVGHI